LHHARGGIFLVFPVYISTTLSYLSDRMKALLKNVGVTFDIQTNDEAYIILHAINLLETKLGVKGEIYATDRAAYNNQLAVGRVRNGSAFFIESFKS